MSPKLLPIISKIVTALEEKKGMDIQVLEVGGLVSYTDFLILCSGTSTTHVNALVSSVREGLPKSDRPVYVNSSRDDSWWILDFVDVVVHVFKAESRFYYDLDSLWCDAKKLTVTK
jgi:ribosome-associated protein